MCGDTCCTNALTGALSGQSGFQLLLVQQHDAKNPNQQEEAPTLLSWSWNVNQFGRMVGTNTFFICARRKQARLYLRRQEGSACRCQHLLFNSFPPHNLLFMHSGVKGHEVINCKQPISCCLQAKTFPLYQWAEFWGVSFSCFLRTELSDMWLQGFVIVWLG